MFTFITVFSTIFILCPECSFDFCSSSFHVMASFLRSFLFFPSFCQEGKLFKKFPSYISNNLDESSFGGGNFIFSYTPIIQHFPLMGGQWKAGLNIPSFLATGLSSPLICEQGLQSHFWPACSKVLFTCVFLYGRILLYLVSVCFLNFFLMMPSISRSFYTHFRSGLCLGHFICNDLVYLYFLSSVFVFGGVYVFVLHTLIWFDVVSLFPVQFPAASIVDARGCLNIFLPASFPPACFFTWVLLVCRHPGFFYPIWEQQAVISSFLSWLFFNSFFINSVLTLSLSQSFAFCW